MYINVFNVCRKLLITFNLIQEKSRPITVLQLKSKRLSPYLNINGMSFFSLVLTLNGHLMPFTI